MINFRKIDDENFAAIVNMKRPEGEDFVATNAYSLAQAWLYHDAGDVYPFAIYNDHTPVGFMMLDEDLDERYLVIWRIMFPEENRFKGYGTEAIGRIIELARKSGKYDYMIIGYKPDNAVDAHVYKKLGFLPTGEVNNGEIVLKLEF